MQGLPQLIEEDIQLLEAELSDFLSKSEANVALILDKAGFMICRKGNEADYDLTTISALAANAFAATQAIAQMLNEPHFSCLYHQGDNCSLVVQNIDDNSLLVILFNAQINVGMIKYYAALTIINISDQLRKAYERDPSKTMDLPSMNMADPSSLFKKQTT